MTIGTTLTDRALIRVAGDDVRGFLQGLVTQDVTTLDASAPRWSGLLTPQGKALFDFLLWTDGDAILIDCEAMEAASLVRRLSMYRLRRVITIEPVEGAVQWAKESELGVTYPRRAALGKRLLGMPSAPAPGWLAHRFSLGVT